MDPNLKSAHPSQTQLISHITSSTQSTPRAKPGRWQKPRHGPDHPGRSWYEAARTSYPGAGRHLARSLAVRPASHTAISEQTPDANTRQRPPEQCQELPLRTHPCRCVLTAKSANSSRGVCHGNRAGRCFLRSPGGPRHLAADCQLTVAWRRRF